MAKIITMGTGITKRDVVLYDVTGQSPEDAAELRKLDAIGIAKWNSGIKEVGFFGLAHSEISEILRSTIEESGGDVPEIDSPEYFARQILKYIGAASEHIVPGDAADRAARFAFEAGVIWGVSQMKGLWEQDALRGATAHAGRKKAGSETAKKQKQKADVWRTPGLELAKAARQQYPRIGQRKIAEQIEGAVAGAPDRDSIVKTIRIWEAENVLPKSIK